MFNKFTSKVAIALVVALTIAGFSHAETFGSGPNAFTMNFVPIGNAGNVNDSTGYGGVSYEYRMAVTDVSQAMIQAATASGLRNVISGPWTGSQPANVVWYEAAAFVNWLNTITGHQAAYNLTYNAVADQNGNHWSMSTWAPSQAWQAGGQNLYRHKNAFYFLPNENEWYKAAYYDGTSYSLYATGSNTAPTPIASGTGANTAVYSGVTSAPAVVDKSGGLSPYGTRGQTGNINQWLETSWDGLNTNPSAIRVIRGGAWGSSAWSLSSSGRAANLPASEIYAVGFRVASVPVPVNAARVESFGSGPNAFTLNFVGIGNAGNADDATTGYGGVPYDYGMAVTDVSQAMIDAATASGLTGVTAGAWTGSQPAGFVTWFEAAAFVNWLNTSTGHQAAYNLTYNATPDSYGNRWSMSTWGPLQAWQVGGQNLYRHKNAVYFLANENEWYKAAYYSGFPVDPNNGYAVNGYSLYATGSNVLPTAVASGTGTNTVVYNNVGVVPAAVDQSGGLSPYGTRGQTGNSNQWLETSWDTFNTDPSANRVIRGGAWVSDASALLPFGRFQGAPGAGDDALGVGIRVASIPVPVNSFHAEGFGSGANVFSIDFVPIGDPGNASDTTAFGAVPYRYEMSVTELSQAMIDAATASGFTNVTVAPWTGGQPAGDMRWFEAAAFVNWLNTSTGHHPAYNLTYNSTPDPEGNYWSMSLWNPSEAWQLGGQNLYRHKDAVYFLPNDDEWYKAAYYNGAGYSLYAFGGNTATPTPVASGTGANTAVYLQSLDGSSLPAAVDQCGGLSFYGTRGQSGNVNEWVETSLDRLNSDPNATRVVRGGSYRSAEAWLLSSVGRFEGLSVAHAAGVGFRVARVTVSDFAPTISVSSPAFACTAGDPVSIAPTLGPSVTWVTVSPALGNGLNVNANTGVISGTAAGTLVATTYTLTAYNSTGQTAMAAISITVNDVVPSSLTYSDDPVTYTKGVAIASNTPSSIGGTVISYSVSPPLPAGLTLEPGSGVITGTPTAVAPAANYTVTASNSGGSTTKSVSIAVNDVAPSSLTYSDDPVTYTKGMAVTNNTPSSVGGAVISYSVSPPLPPGLTLEPGTGVITGIPTAVAAIASYVVTATNSGGSTMKSVSITVNDVAPSSLTYTANQVTYIVGNAIGANSPSSGGGTVVSYSVSPPLPAGLTLDPGTGVITGTPTTVAATASYTVTATNSGGFATVVLTIVVNIPSSDASLFNLSLSPNALSPAFASGTASYTATVPNSTTGITATATASYPNAMISLNGAPGSVGACSGVITLNVGTNTITALVTAEDGVTKQTYTVTVTRLTNLETWRQSYFPGSTSTTGPGANSAMPEGDGVINLLKFATGMDPTKSSTMPGTLTFDGTDIVFSYTPTTGAVADGITFNVEYSDTLADGSWQTDIVHQGTIASGGSVVTATIPRGAGCHRYVRLRIDLP